MLTRRLWRHASARTAACDALAGDLLETLLAGLSTASCQRGESGARKSGISVQESCEGFHPKVGNNLGTTAPKHQGKQGSRADQKAGRINKIDVPALSAKPPSPVQIRAAPPI